jgi:hypothetical protein
LRPTPPLVVIADLTGLRLRAELDLGGVKAGQRV